MQDNGLGQGERARLLRQLLEQHGSELSARKHDLRGLSVDGADAVEDAESSMVRESRGLGAAMASISSRTVQLIEDALRRIESGTYGHCSDCGSTISPLRLHALPFAEACRDCQERRDLSYGGSPIVV